MVAVGAVTTLKLTRESFTMLLGELRDVMKHNFNHKVLAGMDMFRALSNAERETLIESLEERSYAVGKEILKQGDPGEDFFIIKSGSVRVTQTQQGSTRVETIKEKLGAGEYFGEMALLNSEPRMATITATTEVVCMQLARDTFVSLLGPLSTILNREAEVRKKEAEAAKKPIIHMKDLKVHNILGVGTFGRVKLVVHKPTDTPYALKCMRKGQIIALKQVEHVMNEKKILAMCDHPFLLQLAAAYQDADELYMLLELALGGELFTILRERQKFDEPTSRFYGANVAAAFEYLHERKIVYRDLKPENVLLDSEGHVRITDFGLAKDAMELGDKTHTFCGTPDYLAPEIIKGAGHGRGVDWWSLGTMIYEMLGGLPPFYSENFNVMYDRILRKTLEFNPDDRFGSDARDLLTGLLQKSPELRLGSSERDGAELREHAWFAPIDWAKLEARELEPSFKPNVKSATDTSNFDDEFTSQPIAESVMPETALGGKGQQYEGFTYVDKGHLG